MVRTKGVEHFGKLGASLWLLVPGGGLEPPTLSGHGPKPCASSNSATPARLPRETLVKRGLPIPPRPLFIDNYTRISDRIQFKLTMKIKFLGTSAGWPLPRLGCRDEVCSSKDPRDTRTRSQALVNEVLLLDLGPDTYQHLKQPGIDPTKIRYAAISHEHPDHTFGLWDLSHTYTKEGRQKIKILINPKTLAKIRFMFFPNEYDILPTLAGTEIELDSLRLTFLPVNHTKDSTFGVLVKEGNKRFFWAPDFKSLPTETIAKVKGADLAAIDGSELRIKTPSHETIEEGTELGKTLQAKNVYFVHIGHRTLPHRQLETFVRKIGGKNFHIPYDSLEIEI